MKLKYFSALLNFTEFSQSKQTIETNNQKYDQMYFTRAYDFWFDCLFWLLDLENQLTLRFTDHGWRNFKFKVCEIS